MAVFNGETWREIIGKESVIHKVSHSHHKKIRKISNIVFLVFRINQENLIQIRRAEGNMLNQEGWNLCFFIKVDISEIYISFVFFSAKQKKKQTIYVFPIRQPF